MALVTGLGVPSESGIVEIPEAPQVLPQGLEMVLGPERSWGWGLSLWCTESDPRSKAGPTPSTNHSCGRSRTSKYAGLTENKSRVLEG